MKCVCPQCQCTFEVITGRFNRAQKIGAPLYCGRACAGMAHRSKVQLTEAQKRASKAEYDRYYRAKHGDMLKAKKSEYFKRSYDPKTSAVIRKERMHAHIEYCRRPEYKAWKSKYDQRHRAVKTYGEFAESFLTLLTIENTLDSQATWHERHSMNGTINKAQTRRRAL